MGAAFADRRLDGREIATVKELLAKIMGEDELPTEMDARLKSFKPSSFDEQEAAKGLQLDGDEEKRQLLDLIAAVNESDDELVQDVCDERVECVVGQDTQVQRGRHRVARDSAEDGLDRVAQISENRLAAREHPVEGNLPVEVIVDPDVGVRSPGVACDEVGEEDPQAQQRCAPRTSGRGRRPDS